MKKYQLQVPGRFSSLVVPVIMDIGKLTSETAFYWKGKTLCIETGKANAISLKKALTKKGAKVRYVEI